MDGVPLSLPPPNSFLLILTLKVLVRIPSFPLLLGFVLDLGQLVFVEAVEALMDEVALVDGLPDPVKVVHVELGREGVTCLTKEE